MYKTVSITNRTYQELNNLATRLNKPKSQVIDDLVKDYSESMQDKERQDLKEFNARMDKLISKVKFPKGTKVSTDNLDEDFAVLKDIDY